MRGDGALGGVDNCLPTVNPGWGVPRGGEIWAGRRCGSPANASAGMTWGDGALGGADDCFANLSFRA